MQIKSNDLGGILDDNSDIYIQSVKAAIDHADPECVVTIRKDHSKITFHITPSKPEFRQAIINNILELHRNLKIKTNFSKSTNISTTVSFSVEV